PSRGRPSRRYISFPRCPRGISPALSRRSARLFSAAVAKERSRGPNEPRPAGAESLPAADPAPRLETSSAAVSVRPSPASLLSAAYTSLQIVRFVRSDKSFSLTNIPLLARHH